MKNQNATAAPTTKVVTAPKSTKEVPTSVEAKVKKDADALNLKSILPELDKNLFIAKERKGSSENVYQKKIFAGLDEKETKAMRRLLRNNLENYTSSFIAYAAAKNKAALAKLKESFESYYKEAYRVNDFTLASILPGNAGQAKKDEVVKMLEILKSIK